MLQQEAMIERTRSVCHVSVAHLGRLKRLFAGTFGTPPDLEVHE
jgi:hypothetical protein